MRALASRGLRATWLGIGPMSDTVIEAALRLAGERRFPLLFIASRNQVDSAEFGSGYVRGWDQAAFAAAVRGMAGRLGFDGLCYLCRDHGGPWQRDRERGDRLPAGEAMEIAGRSLEADLEAGFDLLHVDPTKDPHAGETVPLDTVLRRTVDLVARAEDTRRRRGLPEVAYEVGTEETSGGLTSEEAFAGFAERLAGALGARGLPPPAYIVGQTGTLTRLTENVGRFSPAAARRLSAIALRHGMGLKEHNGDYLPDATLALHPGLGVAAVNVAPEFGVAETAAWLALAEAEDGLAAQGLVARPSSLAEALRAGSVRSERWRKWMTGDDVRRPVEDVLGDARLSDLIARVGGHYAFDLPEVRARREALEANLGACGLRPRRFVVDALKRSMGRYVDCLNLEGVTDLVRAECGAA